MLYGLSGASGTGKTTLGRAVGDCIGIPFIPTDFTSMARAECSRTGLQEMTVPERLRFQEQMLLAFLKKARAIKGHAIMDRTPMDLAAYLLAEIHMHSSKKLTVEECRRVDGYVTMCQKMTYVLFDHVFVVRPLPSYEESTDRPAYNPAYQRHIQMLIEGGLLSSTFSASFSALVGSDLTERRDYVAQMITARIAETDDKRRTCRHLH
jgi:predicted ATPase